MAPELLTSAGTPREHHLHTNETEFWAFGMTIYVRFKCYGKCTTHGITIAGSDIPGDFVFQPSHRSIRYHVYFKQRTSCTISPLR